MSTRVLVILPALYLAAWLAGCAGARERAAEGLLERRLLSSFESQEQMVGWAAGEGATIERSAEKVTAGSRALRVTVPENVSAGVEYYPEDGDWSRFTSLRMDVTYPYEDRLPMVVRLDDADSSEYNTRFNRDDGSVALVPGRSEIDVPLRALGSGQPGSRGLDLRQIRGFYLFPLGDHAERTFYLDNVRLEALDPEAFPSPRMIDGFEEAGKLGVWQLSEGVQVAPAEEQATEGERSLRVRLPEGGWPGISIFDLPRNWLPYEWLLLDVYNGTDDTMMLGVWVRDGTLKVTVATALRRGANHIRIPMDLFSSLRLRTITGLCIFVGQPASEAVLYVDNIILGAQELGALPEGGFSAGHFPRTSLVLDYGALAPVARNTGFSANIYGENDEAHAGLVRLRPTDKKTTTHRIMAPQGKLVVSSFFLDHDTWYFDTRTVEVAESGATTVRYEPGDFGH